MRTLIDSATNPAFETAVSEEAVARARRYIAGIKSYRQHPASRDAPEAPVVWSEGTTRLRDYGMTNNAPLLLVVPSLINRFDILDLDFAPSFLRTLAAGGFRPLVVDWDEPGAIEQKFSLDDYVKRLGAALAFALKKYGATQVHLLGYCMGGLLALALASLRPERVKSLCLMATPWDFHQPDPELGRMLTNFAGEWKKDWQSAGQMPVDILQGLFAVLQPFQAESKFINFAGLNPDSMEARRFVLLEDWLNDGVPLPCKVAEECLDGWYGKNRTANYAWEIMGQIIDPRKLSMPSYVVVPMRDRIVPPESALPLAKLLPKSTLHEPMTGHIGMMGGRKASQQVWKPLLHWLQEHA